MCLKGMSMNEFLLRRAWKNDIFEYVSKNGLNPLDFQWFEEETDFQESHYTVSVLRHKGSNYFFKFDREQNRGFCCKFSPGELELVEEMAYLVEDMEHWEWEDVLHEFEPWLLRLKKEIAPDLWEQLTEYAPDETLIGKAEISNVLFSYPEVENIIGSLDKLQAQIEKHFNLRGEQLSFVKREIDYLKDAAKRQGRKDWMHTAIGVIITIAVGLALSPEKTKLLWDLLKSCFANLLQLPAP
jgi:hypothetical protein